jgi:hypothetical protein
MAIHEIVGDVAHLVARVAVARAESESATPTTSSPAAQQTEDDNKKDSGNSPLLFFVALGFGVVFTNLW